MSFSNRRDALVMVSPPLRDSLGRRYWAVALLAGTASLVLYGLLAAIIPNPIFGRIIPADASAIVVWIVSAPLMGMLAATYVVGVPARLRPTSAAVSSRDDSGSGAFTLGGFATFFAIGCPICNKIVLLALGTSGALNLFAPIQPLIGGASLVLLLTTLIWRLRRRAQACARPVDTTLA
jgi:hypothetical protein